MSYVNRAVPKIQGRWFHNETVYTLFTATIRVCQYGRHANRELQWRYRLRNLEGDEMTTRYGTVPDAKFEALNDYLEAVVVANGISGIKSRVKHRVNAAFCAGWDNAMEHAGKGELLAEVTELQSNMLDLDMTDKVRLVYIEFVHACVSNLVDHDEHCECHFCKEFDTFEKRRDELEEISNE